MAVYSQIEIKFTEDLALGKLVAFDIHSTNTFGTPFTYTIPETFVIVRNGSYKVTAATSSTVTGIVGERTAINYLAAIQADLGSAGYTYSRIGNTVTIRFTHTSYSTVEFYVGGLFANYTNPASVQITIQNNVTEFEITAVNFATASTPCSKVSVSFGTTELPVTVLQPFSQSSTLTPNSFEWNRGETFSIVLKNGAGVTASYTAVAPQPLKPENFTYSNIASVLSINPTTPTTGLNLQYSLDGQSWQTGRTFSDVPDSFNVYVKDQLGCSFSYSQVVRLDPANFILAGSPYYVTYTAPAASFDYCTLNLYVWEGENVTPVDGSYDPLTAYKAKNADDFVYFEISDYIKSKIQPQLDRSWYSDTFFTADTTDISVDTDLISVDTTVFSTGTENLFREVVWVRWVIRAYKITGELGVLSETIQSPLHCASLGWGYHIDGANSSPQSDILINPVDKYSTPQTINYLTAVNLDATNTNKLIKRQVVETDKIISSYYHREFQIIYLNRFGVWDSMLMNRASKSSVNITSEKNDFYQYRPDRYSPFTATSRVSNISAKEEWTLNTHLLDEEQNRYMEELFESPMKFLLHQQSDSLIPVNLTDTRFDPKLGVYDKANIQWTLKFEGANNKINDIR